MLRLLLMVGLFLQAHTQSRLLAIREVFTSGIRYPSIKEFSPSTKNEQLGQLMQEGKRMQYLLGRKLYEQYWQALQLPPSYNQSYFNVESIDCNASIESVQAQFYGLFEALVKPNVNNSGLAMPYWDPQISGTPGDVYPMLNYQPIPVHIRKSLAQLYVHSNEHEPSAVAVDICPESEIWYRLNKRTDFYTNKFRPIYDEVKKQLVSELGTGGYSMHKIENLLQSARANQTLGLEVMSFLADQTTITRLKYLYFTDILLRLYYTDYQVNASISEEFISLRHQLRSVIYHNSTFKFFVKSGHNINIIGHLAGLRLTSPDCLYYLMISKGPAKCEVSEPINEASSLIYQLHSTQSQGHSIKVRFNGRYLRLPFCQNISCPYEHFETFLNQTIIPNYRSECHFVDALTKQAEPSQHSNSPLAYVQKHLAYFLALVVLTILLFVYSCLKIIRYRLKRNQKKMMTLDGKSDQPEIQMKEKTATDVERDHESSKV